MEEERGAGNVASGFKNLITTLFPGATISQLEVIFGGRASRGTLSNWRNGKQSIPQWARDAAAIHHARLAAHHAELADLARKEKTPGRKVVGRRNLLKWQAEQAAKR